MKLNNCYLSLIGAGLATLNSTLAAPIQVTTKPTYYLGERLEILISYTAPAQLTFNERPETSYQMDNVYRAPDVRLPVMWGVTAPHTWTNRHIWSQYAPALGHHTVIGTVNGYGSASISFEVVPTPDVSGNLLVDFETIPGTTARVDHLMAYDAFGIRFHTSRGSNCVLAAASTNAWVQGFDPYPTGFHVIADFQNPVFAASSKVGGGTGVRITMIAKNASGQVLASDECAPITQPGQFVQSLSVRSAEPIASIEWWPSQSNSGVEVDDLFLVTSPSPVINAKRVANRLQLSWQTVAGADYQLWSSTDLQTWLPLGSIYHGTGGSITHEAAMGDYGAQFFRLSRSD